MKIAQTPDVDARRRSEAASPDPVAEGRDSPRSYAGLLGIYVGALNAVRSPLCVVAQSGQPVFVNRAGDTLLRRGRWVRVRRGRIVSVQPHAGDISLAIALERLRQGRESIVLLRDPEAAHEAVISVAPLSPGTAAGGRCWPGPPPRMGAPLGLLVSGEALRAAAAKRGISIHTARNQLKAIQRKTGRRTQAQLLTLVSRVSSLRMQDVG